MKTLFLFLSNGRNLILLFCLFLLFFFLLSSFIPREHALDLRFNYSVEEAYDALGKLDSDQRDAYRIGIWVLDLPYMVVYFLLFSGILLKLLNNKRTLWIPSSIFVMDLFENLLVYRMLEIYPVQSEMLATMASFFTTTKWVMAVVLVVFLIGGIFYFIRSRKIAASKSHIARI